MQSQSYNDYTAPRQAEPYRSGKSWIQPSLIMPSDKVFKSATELSREPFPTIDEALNLSEQLQSLLKKLGEQKYPLDVRKARRKGVETMPLRSDDRESKQIRAGSRTYFIDLEETGEGKPYLRITESRFKGKGGERERNSIVVFPEEIKEFVSAVSELAAKLG